MYWPQCTCVHILQVHLGGETGQSGRHITGSTVRVTVSYQGDYVEGFKAALQKRAQEVLEKKQKHKKNVSELSCVLSQMVAYFTLSVW